MRERSTTFLDSRRPLVSRLGLALVLLLAFSSAPAAAQKFDLGPYSDPLPTVGDFKVFELSTGGTLTVEVLEVVPEKKGLRITTQTTETGLDPTFEEIFVIPGKAALQGDMYSGVLFFDLKKPITFYRFKAKLGKPNKIRGSGRAFYEGVPVGSAAFGGSWVFAGLEPLDTPVASYPDTAVLEMAFTVTVKDRVFGNLMRVKVESTSWKAPGIGEVAEHYRVTSWLNGSLVEDTGWIDAWLVDGSLGGEPIP